MKSPNKICLYCGIAYHVKPYLIPTSKYCSNICKNKNATIKIKAKCLICNKEFKHISARCNTAKYCSNQCRYKAHKDKGRTQYECQHCHKLFNAPLSTKRKYCSKQCVNKSSHLTFKPNYTTVRKAMIARGLITCCNRCNYNHEPLILGVHHIDRNRNNNELTNLEVLCPNCHSLEHLKHIAHGFQE